MSGLTPEQIRDYRQRGYLRLDGLFGPAEVEALRAESDRLVAEHAAGGLSDKSEPFPRRDAAGRVVPNLIDPVVPRSRLLGRLLHSEPIVLALRCVFDDEPRLFKDKLILRPPGSGGYGLHQDFAYWGWTGARADQLAAVQVAIDDAGEGNGAVCFYPGMHDRLLPSGVNGGNDIDAELMGSRRAELVPTRAGDVILFHPLTPHWSDVNRSNGSRRTLYLTYNAAAAGDLYRIYYQDRGSVVGAREGAS